MSSLTIYHNPKCTKSRQTLQLLQDKGEDPEIIKYLDTPPDVKTLRTLVNKLGLERAHDLVRTKEKEYKEAGLSKDSDDETVLQAIADYPKLLERPVVVRGNQAVIGRPPENARELIE
jgi:arsenate reductase